MDIRTVMHDALMECRRLAGSESQFARDLGVPQPTMWRWINLKRELPAEYVLQAESLYGVSRHRLRPDLYPVERRRARKAVA
jgi:DNA-binding transcriptional regulator YdaS (Cro superfamily)